MVLPATVTDRQGSLITDLGEQDFQVYENGVAQHIQLFKNEDIPVAVGLVIDHSTSMSPKLAEVVAAARVFVRSSNREDAMFVVNFNEVASLGLPAGVRFTDNTVELERAILTKLSRGQTALYDAVAMGLEQLQAANRDKKALIVVSDGGDNASRRKLDEVMKLAEQSTAVIYTVGVFDQDDPDKNPDVLKHLARATGGEAFLPEPVRRNNRHLRTHRPRHSPSIYPRIYSQQSGPRRFLSFHSRAGGEQRTRQTHRCAPAPATGQARVPQLREQAIQ